MWNISVYRRFRKNSVKFNMSYFGANDFLVDTLDLSFIRICTLKFDILMFYFGQEGSMRLVRTVV